MKVVVTGGAGFIGSHLAHSYVDRGSEVIVVDDLSTGRRENVPDGASLVVTDLNDPRLAEVLDGADLVLHQAASRAVQRSVDDPLATDLSNTHGTLSLLVASRQAGVGRVVVASSSSLYGGVAPRPTPESAPLTPKSPYAVSKLAAEQYTRVFAEVYGLETVALRYFNVFGPRQDPEGPYAAVIPRFIEAVAARRAPVIHGDGLQTRDFTFVEDVVRANELAAAADAKAVSGRTYNIACGQEHSLLDVLEDVYEILGRRVGPEHAAPRIGDVRASRADIAAAGADLGFRPAVSFRTGLERTVDWMRREGVI
ncbi:MAG TPA: NAD-dependent epimerase/dehydratase family protein [Acidimicrobiales bacterium]|nr:NAD-dependent epimerase/dehydratase family protein [Acidimicrobiales bacterium]